MAHLAGNKRLFHALAALAGGVFLVSGCTTPPPPRDTVTIAMSGEPPDLNATKATEIRNVLSGVEYVNGLMVATPSTNRQEAPAA